MICCFFCCNFFIIFIKITVISKIYKCNQKKVNLNASTDDNSRMKVEDKPSKSEF